MSDKRSETIGIMVTLSVRREVEAIAADEDRSLSYVAGVLLERGLEAFREDGLLRTKVKNATKLKLAQKRRRLTA